MIASSAENVVATRIDQASPEPQYLFTLAGINKKTSEMHNNDPFKFPSLNPTLSLSSNAGNLLRSAMKKTNEENKLTTKDNPIFIDSDNETYHLEKKKQVDVTSVIQVPVTINPNNKPDFSIKIHQNSLPTVENVSEVYSSKDERLKLNNSCTAVGRFRVEKIADIYTVKQTAAAPSEHHTFAYDNQGYNIGSEESLVILG